MPAEPFPYNRVQLEGNLGQDPEIRHTTGGTIIAEISLAVYDGKDQNGEPKTAWMTVKAFNKVAELFGTLRKGSRLRIKEGKISQESWVDRATGGKRSKLVIIAWEAEEVAREPKPEQAQDSSTRMKTQTQQPQEIDYDDVPF